jgi:hypothetical protein
MMTTGTRVRVMVMRGGMTKVMVVKAVIPIAAEVARRMTGAKTNESDNSGVV